MHSASDQKFWEKWQHDLQGRIRLPCISESQQPALAHAMMALEAARETLGTAVELLEALSRQDPSPDPKILKQANAVVEKAKVNLQESEHMVLEAARQVLSDLECEGFLGVSSSKIFYDLLTWTCIEIATPKYLAEFCQATEKHVADAFVDLFRLPCRLLLYMMHGPPSHGHFGRAFEIFMMLSSELHPGTADPTVQRLALAIALELAAPEDKMVVHPGRKVDPKQRFIHYQQAFIMGDLDPSFSRLNVWELRMAIDSDATEDELGWGRESLKNHRPDLVLLEDPKWRYCRIVRTDVAYKDPVFYKEPRSYDQILSGGGKCGPRAWYGRFACKAFGCPTWGVTQPGHAAMSRWTENGWVICLGAGFEHSFWLNRCGNDFLLETQARTGVGNEQDYMSLVSLLEWAALFNGEKEGMAHLRNKGEPQAKYPWTALSYYQRRLWSVKHAQSEVAQEDVECSKENQISRMNYRSVDPQPIQKLSSSKIVIPAESFEDHPTGNSITMKSFLGGLQLWLGPSAEVSYKLESPMVGDERRRYKLHLVMNTVHRDETPLLLTVSDSDGEDSFTVISPIAIPYTMGLWQETEPVIVELGGPEVPCVTLTFTRQADHFGIAIKEIQLLAVEPQMPLH